jgi:DNA-binding transcriptional MerR regulator/methylmalonyl-CoA mutase cobalamin-binding subunit
MDEPRYRIGTVARLVGLSTHAIRVWERRYGSLSPSRSTGGARLYSDADVLRLRLLKGAVDRGHPIGQIVGLGDAELSRLAGELLPVSREHTPADVAQGESLVRDILAAVREFDAARAERLLDRAQVGLSARDLVRDVFGPLLVAVGDAWAEGKICAASEHVASVLVRERAGRLLRSFPRDHAASTLLVTTPEGELHELGALLAAVTAAMHGAGVVYLGPNLPATEIAGAAAGARADAVALSVIALDPARAAEQIRLLHGLLPSATEIVVGGGRARALSELGSVPAVLLKSLDEFERWVLARQALGRA